MKKKKRAFPLASLINVSRYTFDVWMNSYPQSTQEEWIETTQSSIIDFLYYQRDVFLDAYEEYTEENYPDIRIIPLDNRYMKWLNDNHLQNTQESRLKYVNLKRTDEEVLSLMKENGWDSDYELMGIPVIVFNSSVEKTTSTNFKLSDKSKNALCQYLQNIYDNDDIYVTNYILKGEEYCMNHQIFLNMAKAYFEENVKVEYKKWETQKYKNKNINVYQLVIPYVIRKKFKTARFNLRSMEEDMYYMMSEVSFDKETFALLEKQNVLELKNSKLEKTIINDLKIYKYYEVSIASYALFVENIPEELEMFQKALIEVTRKNRKVGSEVKYYT